MTYVEYLKLVRVALLHPAEADKQARFQKKTPTICSAAVGMQSAAYSARLQMRVIREMNRIDPDVHLGGVRREGYYPSVLGRATHQPQHTIDDIVWRQTVRHQLLDRLIGEAYLEETS